MDYKGIAYTGLSRRQRSLVTKFKVGVLPLAIEVGRYKDVPLEKRLCCICKDKVLEDEFHFLLYCEALKDIRSEFFEEYNWLDDLEDPTDEAELLKLVLNSHNLRKTARFIENMFDQRMKLMFK